jgi:uncharacterized membrane protein
MIRKNRRDFILTAGASTLGLALHGCGIVRKPDNYKNEDENPSSTPIVFERFGLIPTVNGAKPSSSALSVSRDGTVIVGSNDNGVTSGTFRWTKETGAVDMEKIVTSSPLVSGDGKVIVGRNGAEASRWTQETGIIGLGHLPGASGSEATATSYDGSVVVGTSDAGVFRWTKETGMVGLIRVPNVNRCRATGISSDGKVIIGMCNATPFRWTQETGMVLLTALTKVRQDGNNIISVSDFITASALSPNGSTIYGTSGSKAYQWTQSTGMTLLDEVEAQYNVISSVSGDGSVILGSGSGAPYIRIGNKTRDLKETLVAAGAPIQNYDITSGSMKISEDGRTIVGQTYKLNQSYNHTFFEAFRLHYPPGFNTI